MPDTEECSECEDLREQLKLVREVYNTRNLMEKQRWEQLKGCVQEILIIAEMNIKRLGG